MDDVRGSESSERPNVPSGDDPQPAPQWVGHPQPMAYPTTNGTAIMALVATLVPFPFLGGILGIVLGIFGLREIRRNGQSGGAVAVAAIIVGSIQLAIALTIPVVLAEFGLRLFGIR